MIWEVLLWCLGFSLLVLLLGGVSWLCVLMYHCGLTALEDLRAERADKKRRRIP